MSGPKCNLPPEEHAAVLSLFDPYLSDDEENEIRDMFPHYLFFRNEFPDPENNMGDSSTPIRVCTCSACGETFEAVRGNYPRGKLHGEQCNCPHCGREVTGAAIYKYKYDMPSLTSWIKTAVLRVTGSGALLIQAGDAKLSFTHDDLTGELSWYPSKRYYLAPGVVQCWRAEADEMKCGWMLSWYDRPKKWTPYKTVPDCFSPNMEYNGGYQIVGLWKLRDCKAWKYCQIEDFYHYTYAAEVVEPNEPARWIAQYLAWYALHPQLEMAVKLGFSDAVAELIENGTKNQRFLNWNAKKPADFIRTDSATAKRAVEAELGVTGLREWKTQGAGMRLGSYLDIRESLGKENMQGLVRCAEDAGCNLSEAARYIEKMQPQCARYAVSPEQIIQTWADYLSMAKRFGYDLTEKTVAMPKDLQQRHDRCAELQKLEQKKGEAKIYKRRRKKLEKTFGFALGDLRVVIPTGSEEIVREGKTLHHCVGGYAARHIEGSTTILFIRKRRTPGRSFLTAELYIDRKSKWQIKQIHGYRNEGYAMRRGEKEAVDPQTRYAWFLDTWMGWVNAGSKRDKDGKPVLPEQTEKKERTA